MDGLIDGSLWYRANENTINIRIIAMLSPKCYNFSVIGKIIAT